MRTRSQASAEAAKRKKGDDCAVEEDGARSKRQKVRIPPEAPHQEFGEGLCSPGAKTSISGKRKRGFKAPAQDDGAGNKQRRVQAPDHHSCAGIVEVPCREGDDEIASGNLAGYRTSPNTVFTNKSQFQGHILALPAVFVNSSATASKKQNNKDTIHRANKHGVVPLQGNSMEQCSSALGRNLDQSHQEHLRKENVTNCEDPIQLFDDCQETAILQLNLADKECQSEKGNQNAATSILPQNAAEKQLQYSHRRRSKGISSGIDSFHVDKSQRGSCTDPMRKKHVHLRSHSAQKNKQSTNTRRAKSVPMLMKSKKSNIAGIRAAKLRWKHLMQSIISAKCSPGSTSADAKFRAPQNVCEHRQDALVKEQTTRVDNCQNYGTQSLRKKRKRLVGHDSSSAGRQRPTVDRQQRKISKQLRSLLRLIKTWLIQAKFSKGINDQNSNDMGETFIMTEDERNGFAQTMVKSCQQNENLRTLFLESVRILTMSGLMHAAASTLLQEETCEQAQTLMDAWAEFKEQSSVTGPMPMNLLKAVNQLHEKRGDLSTKLNKSENSFGLKQLDEKTWKLELPAFPKPKPIVTKNIGQNDIPV